MSHALPFLVKGKLRTKRPIGTTKRDFVTTITLTITTTTKKYPLLTSPVGEEEDLRNAHKVLRKRKKYNHLHAQIISDFVGSYANYSYICL